MAVITSWRESRFGHWRRVGDRLEARPAYAINDIVKEKGLTVDSSKEPSDPMPGAVYWSVPIAEWTASQTSLVGFTRQEERKQVDCIGCGAPLKHHGPCDYCGR